MTRRSVLLRAMCLINPHEDGLCMNDLNVHVQQPRQVQLDRLSPVCPQGLVGNAPRPFFLLYYSIGCGPPDIPLLSSSSYLT